MRERSPRVGPPDATCSSRVLGPRERSGCAGVSGAGRRLPRTSAARAAADRGRVDRGAALRASRSRGLVRAPSDAAGSSGWASSRWLAGGLRGLLRGGAAPAPPCHVLPGGAAARRRPVSSGRTTLRSRSGGVRPRSRPVAVPVRSRHLGRGLLGRGRLGCAGARPAGRRTRRLRAGPSSSVFAGPAVAVAGAFSGSTAACPAPRACLGALSRVASSAACAASLGSPVRARGAGRRFARRVGRPLEDRGEAVPCRRLWRGAPRSLDPSLLPSLGARGRSGYSTAGCGCAVFRDERSVTRAAASAACRAEDLLVQPFVPVRGRAACLAILRLGPPAASRATSTRFFPHLGRRGSAAGPGGARLCSKDNSPRGPGGSRSPGPDRDLVRREYPSASPSERHARCELVLLS